MVKHKFAILRRQLPFPDVNFQSRLILAIAMTWNFIRRHEDGDWPEDELPENLNLLDWSAELNGRYLLCTLTELQLVGLLRRPR